ncbi:MAG TPA: hypothetical protein VJI13_01305 [Candidatus Norongarragalinales archaeon]|nr:hypothetical protein [Candidatus Norongarragalinales archaeon]
MPEYSSLTFNFGENKYEQPIGRLDSKNQVMLTFDPKKTRSYRLEFTIGYPLETENKRNNFKTADANVEPFGFTEDLAADTFLEVTGENALAESFVFEYPLEVKKFGLYLRKGRNQTYGNSSVILEVWKVVELRKQDGPILTMTSNILSLKDEWNWVNFRPPKPLTIESGIYELVIKTNSESPISVHISKDPKNTYLHNAKKSLDDPSNPYFFGAHYEGPFNFRITNDP